jgi:hypothetical protein
MLAALIRGRIDTRRLSFAQTRRNDALGRGSSAAFETQPCRALGFVVDWHPPPMRANSRSSPQAFSEPQNASAGRSWKSRPKAHATQFHAQGSSIGTATDPGRHHNVGGLDFHPDDCVIACGATNLVARNCD